MMKGTGMLKLLVRCVDSELMVIARVSAMLFLILVSTSLVLAQGRDYESERNIEHRISVVETKADGFHYDIEAINTKLGYLMLMVSAVMGERAFLLFKGKFKNSGPLLKDRY